MSCEENQFTNTVHYIKGYSHDPS